MPHEDVFIFAGLLRRATIQQCRAFIYTFAFLPCLAAFDATASGCVQFSLSNFWPAVAASTSIARNSVEYSVSPWPMRSMSRWPLCFIDRYANLRGSPRTIKKPAGCNGLLSMVFAMQIQHRVIYIAPSSKCADRFETLRPSCAARSSKR